MIANRKMGFYVNYKRFSTKKNLMKLIREKKKIERLYYAMIRENGKCYTLFL